MAAKKLGPHRKRAESGTGPTADEAPGVVTPGVADAASEIQTLIASEMRSGIVDVGSDFQMRLARSEDRLVEELKRAGLPPIVPRKQLSDGTEFTQTDLPYRQGEGNQSHRCAFVPDIEWRNRLLKLSSPGPCADR
jgi:hypothetical protein